MSSTHSTPLRSPCKHGHCFDTGNPLAERGTRLAMWLTLVMMVAEIVGGWWYGSMALLADGWHMGSHAIALGLAAFAYAYARKHAADPRYAFGTWKVEVLASYTSALLLLGIAGLMLYESVHRMLNPVAIHYNEAIVVAIIGLGVNLVCAWLLHRGSGHDHGHAHAHDHDHDHHGHGQPHDHHAHDDHQHDLNLHAAYIHVLTDAATSVLAIVALFGGKLWGFDWLDPVMGLVGAVLVAVWAQGLLRDAGKVLLDAEMDAPVVEEIREVIAASPVPASISDLHVWRVGRGDYACIVSLVTAPGASPEYFKQQLRVHEELVHITVELHAAG